MELRIALGEDRWAKVQRSSYEDKIRNCDVSQVTIEELTFIAMITDMSIDGLLCNLISQDTGRPILPDFETIMEEELDESLFQIQESCFETFREDQFDIIIEECSELIKAVCKVKREYDFDLSTFRKNTPFTPIFISNLIEEVADVQITFNQPLEEKPMPEFDPDPIEDIGEVLPAGIERLNRFGDDI